MVLNITSEPAEINFYPASEIEELAQNIRTILTTIKGTCPLYREFGISAENLDLPINIAKTKLAAEIATQISNFEPRCKLKSVDLSKGDDLSGVIKAVVEWTN